MNKILVKKELRNKIETIIDNLGDHKKLKYALDVNHLIGINQSGSNPGQKERGGNF